MRFSLTPSSLGPHLSPSLSLSPHSTGLQIGKSRRLYRAKRVFSSWSLLGKIKIPRIPAKLSQIALMGFTWGYRSKSRKKKKSLSGPVTNGEATIDGNLLGSNDEKFFDTTESLASDYDEFYSAKGDSTPSCEGTPRSRLSTSDPPNKDPSIAPITTLNSDCYPRKNLSAFLQEESVDDDESDSSTTDDGNLDNEEENRSTERGFKHPPHPSEVAAGENSTGSKLQSTPEVNTKRKSKSQRGMNCCLPCRPGGTKSVGE